MPVFILPILWIATAFGRGVNARLLGASKRGSDLIENLFGLATGLGVLSYGILALGLAGQLRTAPMIACIALLALLGGRQHLRIAHGFGYFSRCFHPPVWVWGAILLFTCFVVIGLFGCLTPPTSLEWDSLSYHLADPKIYLANHRIFYLPWESHSNFAFTMEMLYAIGLMAHSVVLAKLFHFALAGVAAFATYALGRRWISNGAGVLAALLFVSLPLVFWEAGTAYVDLAATAYGMLALLALSNAAGGDGDRWVWIAGMMMGWMLGIKATSVVPLILFAAGLLIWRVRRDGQQFAAALRPAVVFGLIAALVGAVWYVKSWIWTQNPVYPFAYHLFGGNYWNNANAVQYARDQAGFGMGHRISDLVLVPWNLTLFLAPGHVPPAWVSRAFNDTQNILGSLSPVFLALLFVGAFLVRPVPTVVKALGGYALVYVVIWFALTQQVRYLLPVIPVLCLLFAFLILRLRQEAPFSGRAVTILAGFSIAFSLYVGASVASFEAPAALGLVPREAFMNQGLDCYAPMSALNELSPRAGGVVFYGEPRDFYCNKPYIWGEPGHSLYVPYERLQTPDQLRAYFRGQGIDFAYVNKRYFALRPGGDWVGTLWAATAGREAPSYEDPGVEIFRL